MTFIIGLVGGLATIAATRAYEAEHRVNLSFNQRIKIYSVLPVSTFLALIVLEAVWA